MQHFERLFYVKVNKTQGKLQRRNAFKDKQPSINLSRPPSPALTNWSLVCCCLPPAPKSSSFDKGGLTSHIIFMLIFSSVQKDGSVRHVDIIPVDRVAIAFKRFDLDNDGFLSWDEFTQVPSMNNHSGPQTFTLDWPGP